MEVQYMLITVNLKAVGCFSVIC